MFPSFHATNKLFLLLITHMLKDLINTTKKLFHTRRQEVVFWFYFLFKELGASNDGEEGPGKLYFTGMKGCSASPIV